MFIYKDFTFDAAHLLPNVPPNHKCANLHGHTYRLRVVLEGVPDGVLGWVIDFAEIKRNVKPLLDQLDHKYLNDIKGLENPTCELLSAWIWDQLKPLLPALVRIEVQETPTSGVIYDGK